MLLSCSVVLFNLVQEVINNLMIAAIEFRSEEDPDVARYTHQKNIHGGVGGAPGRT